ncbi:zona pellucida sperm-binding protein 2 isoform X2 [Ahaetulla prasina]|uniref:zona pellucida sperm-binding protein 2 isoform X2 n=1 Tax=Ahaetulla prasina TaxID=499056 RepID=UPI002649277D|nr:zona pellucida sperm-binding protein 2 isoform X2 [Ahaetulla prasina]
MGLPVGWAFCNAWLFFGYFLSSIFTSGALDFPGTVSCHDDPWRIWLPKEVANLSSWDIDILDGSGDDMEDCRYQIDYGKQVLMVGHQNCTEMEDNKPRLRFRLQFNDTEGLRPQNETYSVDCETLQADEAVADNGFASATTNCTKNVMAVTFPRLIPSFRDELTGGRPGLGSAVGSEVASAMEWIVSIEDNGQIHHLSLRQAIQEGYTFFSDATDIIIQVPFNARGVAVFKQDDHVLYTVAIKLTYGPPEQRLTLESRMICAPGPAVCSSTHMMVILPAFPGKLTAVSLNEKNIPVHQLQANGIGVDTRKGVKLYIPKSLLNTRVYRDHDCSGFQLYVESLMLNFDYRGEIATMVSYPECPCEQNAPIVTICTQDGHMDFEIASSSTKPDLNLDTLRLRDPTCGPVRWSPSKDRVQFRVPLNGCGTTVKVVGEKMVYENEVSSVWPDQPPRWISRDSDFRLTVVCSYESADTSLNVRINTLPPPQPAINQGPLSLLLLIYPDQSYSVPYTDDQYPLVKYLREPIFLEVQVLNRNDPNIHLMLENCWATLSLEPTSLLRWNIVVDGCEYELDNYKTIFHPIGPGVSYANFRQRFEVKAFAFVSDGKALSNTVYFHCSVIICDRHHPDSPLCTSQCPRFSRKRREAATEKTTVVTLPHAVILVPEEQFKMQGQQKLSIKVWIAVSSITVFAVLATIVVVLVSLFRRRKRSGLIN